LEFLNKSGRKAIFITTLYEGLGFEGIDCVDFTKAVESGIAELPTYAVINQDRAKDCFFVYLGFDRISDEVTTVSAADYFLQHYPGHFVSGEFRDDANGLVTAL
jgi:hypothetical protein